MTLEFISELENKIDMLIGLLTASREENRRLKDENDDKTLHIMTLEEQCAHLRLELDSAQQSTGEVQVRMDEAAGRIRDLISRLESVA